MNCEHFSNKGLMFYHLSGSMRRIDEGEVSLKEKPEDTITIYIKKITSK